jgi:assimilatory nitrate reductase catalytic subunit
VLSYEDPGTGALRRAFVEGGRLERVLFITVGGRLPTRDWLAELFAIETLTDQDRIALLAGRPLGPVRETGPIVCACLRVGAAVIERAIVAGSASVESVGVATSAGTNCGSCRPEIARLIARHAPAEEARNAA